MAMLLQSEIFIMIIPPKFIVSILTKEKEVKRYRLTSDFRLRKVDKALFNFQKATLIEFNNPGFALLLELLDGVNRELYEDEVEMVERLLVGGIIEECS